MHQTGKVRPHCLYTTENKRTNYTDAKKGFIHSNTVKIDMILEKVCPLFRMFSENPFLV
jgi:hypothetical protein